MSAKEGCSVEGDIYKWPYSDRQYKEWSGGEDVDGGHRATAGKTPLDAGCRQKIFLSCSKRSWFVIIAAIQMIAVVLLQTKVWFEGGHGKTVLQFRNCVSESLQMAINCSVTANWTNVSIPSFGSDKPVYVGFIVALTIYNSLLCFYALYGSHFLEIVSFLIVNVLTMVYSVYEVWQFRPFSPYCTTFPPAAVAASVTASVLFVFTIVFTILALFMYRDFGWKVYKHVECNHEMRRYYQWYETVSSGVKLVILFTVVFSVAQLSLLLLRTDTEFVLTIILVVVAIVAYFVVQLTIHNNSLTGYLFMGVVGALLIAYYGFKIVRFAAADCPTCIKQKQASQEEISALNVLLQNCAPYFNATITVDEVNRSLQFQNLVIFGMVNIVTVIVVFAIFIGFWCHQPGKKVMEQFHKHPTMIVRFMCYRKGEDHPLYLQFKRVLGCNKQKTAHSFDE